jgi:predicted transcriptional regulator
MEIKINLSTTEHKELLSYCNINDLLISSVVKQSFTTGFNIERYGLLNTGGIREKQVEKEVIVEKRVEIPVEVIKEVVRIEYVEVPVDRIVEIIKEVPSPPVETEVIKYVDKEVIKEVKVEVPVEKIVYIYDKKEEEEVVTKVETNCDEFLSKIQELESRKPEVIEVIKEVQVEVIKEVVVEKESTDIGLKSKLEAIQNTVQKLKQDNIEKDNKIREYEKTIEDIQKFQTDRKAAFLKGSNLDDTLYK